MSNTNEAMKRQLSWRLAQMMPPNDVHTLLDAAQRPNDDVAIKLAEVVWDGLPADSRVSLGSTLQSFVESQSEALRSRASADFIEQKAKTPKGPDTARRWR